MCFLMKAGGKVLILVLVEDGLRELKLNLLR